MTPTREERIGRHLVSVYSDRRASCSIVHVEWHGDVTVDEARAVVEVFAPLYMTERPVFVTDLSRLGKMPSAAIRVLACTHLPRSPGPRSRHRLAYVAANLRTKLIISLILSVASLASPDTMETEFFDCVDDALEWAKLVAARPPSGA